MYYLIMTPAYAIHPLVLLLLSCTFWREINGASRTSGGELRIAWMAPEPFMFGQFNASTNVAALIYAIEEIRDDPNLLPMIHRDKIKIRYADSRCSSKRAIGAIFDMFEAGYNPHLMLGPMCSGATQPVAQLASYLGRPAFAWVASDPSVGNKNVYNTLVRFLGPVSSIGDGFVVLMDYFKWKKVAIVSGGAKDNFGVVGSSIRDDLLNANVDVVRWEQDLPVNPTVAAIIAVYNKMKRESRIIILSHPRLELRDYMLAAFDAGMANGEYVFIYTNQEQPSESVFKWIVSEGMWQKSDGRNEDARKAYQNLLVFYTKTLDLAKVQQYNRDFVTKAQSSTWYQKQRQQQTNLPPPLYVLKPVVYALYLYDAMMTFARLATQLGSVEDGKGLFNRARNYFAQNGASGDIVLGDTADRQQDFWVFDMGDNNRFRIVAATKTTKSGNTFVKSIEQTPNEDWSWGDGSKGYDNRPLDEPVCGFDGEKCPNLALIIAPTVVGVLFIVAVIVGVFVFRKIRYERELSSMAWKIKHSDVNLYTGGQAPGSMLNMRTKSKTGSFTESMGNQLFVTVGNYKGMNVALKTVRKSKVKVDRDMQMEMKQMSELKHSNLNTFVGACTDDGHVSHVWEYCTKGSLQDVLFNDKINLDDMFKFSITIDVIRGLRYIHDSSLKVHGRLKSSNVVIDGRWACKLTDYGLESFTADQDPDPELSEHQRYTRMNWTAPEILRGNLYDFENRKYATSYGDIYGYGVLLKEVFCRNGPYSEFEDTLEPYEIIEKVTERNGDEFRPRLDEMGNSNMAEKLKKLICSCWCEEPTKRPSSAHALKTLSNINPNKNANVMDNMMAMMQKYSNQLEIKVAERTVELEEEKKKTEELLYRMLPRSVAEDLKMGKAVKAESDIVSFTSLAGSSTPMEVVALLNDLYTLFDSAIAHHDVYKVETIGDAYMLVSGLPVRNGDRHVVEIVNCSMDLLSIVSNFKVRHKPGYQLRIRIGVHTGPAVAGVVGQTMPRYCLFGDTVNIASRMESGGAPMRIHLSSSAYQGVAKFKGYHLAERGPVEVKGKGNMTTYWVVNRDGYDKPYPKFEDLIKEDSPQPKRLPVTSGKELFPKAGRPSRESGFSEPSTVISDESRKTSQSMQDKLMEIDEMTSQIKSNKLPPITSLPIVDVTDRDL